MGGAIVNGMSVRLMVLGVISVNPGTHGYDVLRELTAWRAETWSRVRSGSIYHALNQLEKSRLVERSEPEPSAAGPAKSRYRTTPAGEEELLDLARRALTSLEQETFAAGLAFMHLLPREEVIDLITLRRGEFERVERYLHGLPRESSPANPATHPEIIGSWETTFSATKEWLDSLLARLGSGAYRFAGES